MPKLTLRSMPALALGLGFSDWLGEVLFMSAFHGVGSVLGHHWRLAASFQVTDGCIR